MTQGVATLDLERPLGQPGDALVDPFGRAITYLRVSVTDRCDFRCVYCMAENMTFLPKADLLSLEELDRLCSVFVDNGVRKLRLTGGEPLVRRGIMTLVASLSRHLAAGTLDELTVTTNGSQLAKYAGELAAHGVERINVSLDTLDPDKCRAITRWGELDKVLAGIDAALAAGLRVKINAVALKGVNEDELGDLTAWAHGRGMDLTIIEVMPLGDIGAGRLEQYLPLSLVRARLAERYTLDEIDYRTGGPARYVRVKETGGRLGFITPLTHNFCESCNRVRVTCTGTLYMCLGQEDAADLRTPLRLSPSNDVLEQAIADAIARKPKGHDFIIDRRHQRPALAWHMTVPGGRSRRTSPRLPLGRLRPSSTGYGEGHPARRKTRTRPGEGALPQAETRGEAPSPTFSPHAGRRS
jgi:GTP 3',8-cyclase